MISDNLLFALHKFRALGAVEFSKKAARRVVGSVHGDLAARLAYRVVLRRPVEPDARRRWRDLVSRDDAMVVPLIHSLFESEEYGRVLRQSQRAGELLLNRLHTGRCKLVARLPAAANILDLGGAAPGDPRGALIAMGYPHRFETLTIVDLPPGGSVEQSRAKGFHADTVTPLGPVRYVYESFSRLDQLRLPAASFDLIWMGQSFEHVTREELRPLLVEISRLLTPTGSLWLDTPNGRTARLHSPDALLHPDHKHEYTAAELMAEIRSAGLHPTQLLGLGLARRSCDSGAFDPFEVMENVDLNDDPASSYFLVAEARARAGA